MNSSHFYLALVLGVTALLAPALVDAESRTRSSATNPERFRELTKALEDAGFSDVNFLSDMYVARVTREGTSTVLLVDSRTRKAVEVAGARDFLSVTGHDQERALKSTR